MLPHLPLPQYCERAGEVGLAAEPFNTLSNIGFFVVAIAATLRLWRSGATAPTEWTLTAIAAIIGLGSVAFHTLATPWAMAADVLPIGAFVVAFTVLILRRFLTLSWLAVAMALVALGALEAALATVRCNGRLCLDGALPYIPALATLALSAGLVGHSNPAVARRLALAALVFAVALTMRSLDHTLCDALILLGKPRGTHALWHLLNAVALALLLDAAIFSAPGQLRHCTPPRDRP